MVLNIFYTRPNAVRKSDNVNACGKGKKCPKIPPALSFDRVINGETCYPCRLQDFMLYCYFVEHCSENIKFFLWYRSYCEQFEALSEEEKALSPPWTGNDHMIGTAVSAPPSSPKKYEAFENVVAQPLRSEISRISSLFLYPGASLELNLSGRDRAKVLRALSFTTHPSALVPAVETVDTALRWQSHPAFARRALSNANRERSLLLLALACFMAGTAVLTITIMVLSGMPKPLRGIPTFCAAMAVTAYVSQVRAFCFACYLKGRRDKEPWDSNLDLLAQEGEGELESGMQTPMTKMGRSRSTSRASSFDYDEKAAEIHVKQFERQNFFKKGLKWGGRIREPAILKIQRTLFAQTALVFIGSFAIFTAIFLPLPALDLL